MRRFAVRRPLLFAALAIVAGDLLASLAGRLLKAFDLPVMTRMLIGEPIFALYTAVLLTALGWWREAGFRRPARLRDTLVYLPWLALPLLQASDFQASAAGPGLIVATAVFALLVGFAEEGLARGVMLRALLPGGAARAALLSSALFGAAHLSSALAGRDLGSTAVQAVTAAFLGLGFAGCRLAGGTIWPAVVLHGLVDFADFGSRGFAPPPEHGSMTPSGAIVSLVLTGLYAAYGWWLARRWERRRPAGGLDGQGVAPRSTAP